MNDSNIDSEEEVYTTRYEVGSHDSLCYTIVRAVCAVTGDEPTAVDPLYESIDPDALDEVIGSLRRSGDGGANSTVEFTLHDCRVTVKPDGTIELRPPVAAMGRTGSNEGSD